MDVFPISTLYGFVNASVSGGYVVALAFICLLQYVAHVHRLNRARRDQEKCSRELSDIATELIAAQRDRSLTRHENQVLREFLEESDCEKALKGILRRLAPKADENFAACLRARPSGWSVEYAIGFGASPLGGLEVDQVFHHRLLRCEAVVLVGDMLQSSRLWATLPHTVRLRVRELYLFGIGDRDNLQGVFVATGLLFPGGDWPRQLESTARVLSALSGSLRDRWRLQSGQNELQSRNELLQSRDEMLSLRSIADRHFESPLRMIGEFVEQATAKIGAERAALFLFSRNQSPQFRAMIRCGQTLAAGIKDEWYKREDNLALEGMSLKDPVHYSAAELARLKLDDLLGAAMVVPICQQEHPIGLFVFSRREKVDFSPAQRQLANWAGSLLAELFPRVVNQAVVARQARIDALTQLANRGSFDRQIVQELQAARLTNTPLSLLLLDLDRFKSINDRYGHRGGDAVLRAAANLVRECVQNIRVADRFQGAAPFVARYGGEELAILLPRLSLEAARRIGESICEQMATARIDFDGEPIPVTTSIGLACVPDHADSVDELIAAADAALYLAKANGRNRLEVAEAALNVAG
ncbi:MAG TPA: sensor domain-containing diguanylate cyclase [Planctomycetaceae bacterium]|nr:sensor domain-containing diguanylate cyclase [Planctomycetaceae bacterium]